MFKSPIITASRFVAAPRFFVGRDAEIPRIARAFAEEQSIVLWGAGGIGKTSLANHVIARQAWRFGDPPAIASHSFENGLGLDALLDSLPAQLPFAPSGQGLTPQERRQAVLHALRGRHALLLIDNFETAAEQHAILDFLGELSKGCLVLMTTREPVRRPDWLLLEIKPLPADAALRLFAQHLPDGQILQAQWDGAQRLLEKTAGHPLAIELAAALTRDWPDLAELADALAAQRVRLADPTLHGVPERLRDVAASIALSFDRLPEPAAQAQQALAALSVWRTPFDDAGAQAVADLHPAEWAVVGERLRTRSLLYQEGGRYWLHPLVRDFGRHRLTNAQAAEGRAARFLTQRWQSNAPVTAQELLAVPLHWLAAGDWRAAASAADQLTGRDHSLARIGYWSEIASVLRIVIDRYPAGEETVVVGLWNDLAGVLRLSADYTNALNSAQRGLALARQVGARVGEANVLKAIGDVQQFRKESEAAMQSYRQALDLFRQVGDRLGEANVLLATGDLSRRSQDYAQAWQCYMQAQNHYTTIGDVYSQARALYRMGDVLVDQQRNSEAIPLYEEAMTRWRSIGMTDLVNSILLPRLQAAQR